jgi:predicted acetyltransferase
MELILATQEQQPVLANLLELYIHDFSEFVDVEPGQDGRFGYPQLAPYWTDANRLPYLIWIDGRLAGFVLVKREGDRWDIAEFFVVRGQRRRGVGMQAAHQLWRKVPGQWQVRVMEGNPAAEFWTRAIANFTGEEIPYRMVETGSQTWRVFQFESTAIL